jgi:hypothetical protein
VTSNRHLLAVLTLAALGLAAASGAMPSSASAAVSLPPDAAPVPYGPGERLVFSIDYGVVNAGEGTLEVLGVVRFGDHVCYSIESRATSNRFFSAFYKVRDKVVSYIDAVHLYSRYFHKRLREGDYRKNVEITFDHEAGVARYHDGRTFEAVSGVHDALSAFYYVRTLDLAVGDVYTLPAHSSRKTYELKVVVHGIETVEVEAGSFTCFVVEPMLVGEGIFKHEGKLTLYMTADQYKIPVLMKTKVPVGSIDASLKEYRLGRPLVPPPAGAREDSTAP